MKFIATFALVCCVISTTLAEPQRNADELTDPAVVSTGAALLSRFCRIGPLDAIIGVGVAKGTAAGLKKYKETNDMALASRAAAEEGFSGAAGFVTKGIGAIITGAAMVKDIKDGKDIKETFNHRAKETIDYIKAEVINNPKGKVANSLITGANVAATWTVGPIPAFIAASLAKAAADGMQKYKETNDANEAAKEAYMSGYNSAARVIRALCGLVASGTGLAEDLHSGKDTSVALKERGSQALKSILGQSSKAGTPSSTSTTKNASTSKPSTSKNVPNTKKGGKK
ncbi:uncharacterized protein LOC116339575 [Contarinia nasturtii]|uniref:uncharacterized protein LOC116339575 n=1 Tax=Contarinia nasturtii TaxID=265458 RepID=UPI0012D3E080|nr:uncharacterized protein LOC116339575 [Contarinia nasturtii]